jgi:hypothetical protein
MAIAWAVALLVSTLPDVILHEVLGEPAPWLLAAKLAVIALALAAGFAWPAARKLRPFFVTLGLLYAVSAGLATLQETPGWTAVFNPASFSSNMLGIQLSRLGLAAAILLALRLLGLHRRDLYLEKGTPWLPKPPGCAGWASTKTHYYGVSSALSSPG